MQKSEDPLLNASVSVAWVILLNKPFYPLYIWYFIGSGVAASCLTWLSAPLFALVIVVARTSSVNARLLLPAIATIDIFAETWLFGQASGTELFLACAMMLAAISFYEQERYKKLVLVGSMFLLFFLLHGFFEKSYYPWTDDELATLRSINIFSVASLLTFIAIRYPGRINVTPATR